MNNQEFQRAIKYLKRAGYSGQEIGVYIMAGLPGQRVGEVEESLAFVKETGAKPILVEYSPSLIPLSLKKPRSLRNSISKTNLYTITIPSFPASGMGSLYQT